MRTSSGEATETWERFEPNVPLWRWCDAAYGNQLFVSGSGRTYRSDDAGRSWEQEPMDVQLRTMCVGQAFNGAWSLWGATSSALFRRSL